MTKATSSLTKARKALEAARDRIDQEASQARAAVDAAQARYEQAVTSAKERKAAIRQKLHEPS